MNLIPKKYFLFVLAAILVVALGYMAVSTSKVSAPSTDKGMTEVNVHEKEMNQINTQSSSDELNDIETDLQSTDTSGIDQDLEDLGREFDR